MGNIIETAIQTPAGSFVAGSCSQRNEILIKEAEPKQIVRCDIQVTNEEPYVHQLNNRTIIQISASRDRNLLLVQIFEIPPCQTEFSQTPTLEKVTETYTVETPVSIEYPHTVYTKTVYTFTNAHFTINT